MGLSKSCQSILQSCQKYVGTNVIDGRKVYDSLASPSDSLEGADAHAINIRPSFLPRGAGFLLASHSSLAR